LNLALTEDMLFLLGAGRDLRSAGP